MKTAALRLVATGIALGACCAAVEVSAGGVADLLPTPKSIMVENGEMALTAASRIVASDPSLEPLAAILSDEILLSTNLKLAPAKGEGKPGDIVLKFDPKIRADADIVAVQMKDGKQQVVRTRDFAHTIAVGDMALVTGWDYRAACEGTATLLQAITGKDGKYTLPKMTVKDWPHADYTGTMIDAARQWIPPDSVKFTIEACRFWKIRYLQMHFSDDHAWTFGSKAYPELGSRNMRISDGVIARCYTWEEMKDLEAYAVARGVTIVPELETPGHWGAAARSRPDIFNGPGCMPIASEKLYEALDVLVGEMCSIFKASPYFHIGCDECHTGGVGGSPAEKEYMKNHTLPKDDHPLNDSWQVYIMHVLRMTQLARKYGKIAVAWEGVADDYRVKDDIIVMTWYSPEHANHLEAGGWNVITVPWSAGPIENWSMYLANGHTYKRTTNVLGAQRPMWQMSEYSLPWGYVPWLAERQERTWGPDNAITNAAQYGQRCAQSVERMFRVAAPVKVETEGGQIHGVSDGLKGWNAYSGTMTLKLSAPFPTGAKIHYTLDPAPGTNATNPPAPGTVAPTRGDPTADSPVYTGPFKMERDFILKTALFYEGRQLGACNRVKYEWRDQDNSGWIKEYMIAGPYLKDNLPGTQLHDIPFEPETTGKGEWKLWKGEGGTPWICNIPLQPMGDNRTAYMRAQVWSPKTQKGMVQVSSDDGVKVWFNGVIVHQDNRVQSYFDPPDCAVVDLKEGWNTLLLKVGQNDGGWGAMARIKDFDGNKIEGLKFKAE